MNPLARAVRRLGAELKALTFYGGGGSPTGTYTSRSWNRPSWRWGWHYGDINYGREVGDPGANSAVAACVNWIATAFPEAPLRVLDAAGEPIPEHPMLELVDNPNSFYDGTLLMQATLTDYSVTGNAYWIIVKGNDRRPLELWYAPSWMVEPRWDNDGTRFIDHYEYNPNGTPIAIPLEEIVHFRNGLDPTTRLGVSRLTSALGEIFTDREAQAYTGAILKNMGVPGVILAPKAPDASVPKEVADELKDDFKARFGGGNRGEPMVMHEPTDVSVLSFSPEQMNLRDLRRIPEERISAIMGIPAIVAGLGAGLDRSTFANFAEAREMAYESCIIPLQRFIAAALRRQLLRQYTTDRRLRVDFDLSQVRVLQEDENAKSARILSMYAGTLITMAEGRKALNWEVLPEHEVYMVGSKATIVPTDRLITPEPEPVTEPLTLPPGDEEEEEEPEKVFKQAPGPILTADDVEDIYGERLATLGLSRVQNGNGNKH